MLDDAVSLARMWLQRAGEATSAAKLSSGMYVYVYVCMYVCMFVCVRACVLKSLSM